MRIVAGLLCLSPSLGFTAYGPSLVRPASFLSGHDRSANVDRREAVQSASLAGLGVAASSTFGLVGGAGEAEAAGPKEWTKVDVPFEETLFDMDFDTETHVSSRENRREAKKPEVARVPMAFLDGTVGPC